MTSPLDDLADLDPLAITKNPAQLDAVILHYRKQREMKGKRKKDTGPVLKLDLKSLGIKTAPEPTVTRRF